MAKFTIKVRSGQYADLLSGRRSFIVAKDRDVKAGDIVELEEALEGTAEPTGRAVDVVVAEVDRNSRAIVAGFMVLGFRLQGETNDVILGLQRRLAELEADYNEALEALKLYAPICEPLKHREAA